jgi:hypothetical protein
LNYGQILNLLSRRGNEVRGIHLGLHRIATIMESFGSPHMRFAVLHIAGTNGKGSVAAMSESILRAAGCKTGLYTSPHLEKLEERIRVSGREITAVVTPPTRRPARVVLHVRPPSAFGPVKSVTVNGKPWADVNGEAIDLGRLAARTVVVCRY